MDLYPDTLAYAKWDLTTDVDLASATADAFLAGAWQPLDWAGAATQTGNMWTRTAQILVSGANPSSGVKPTADDHRPLVRVTVGGETIPQASTLRFDLR